MTNAKVTQAFLNELKDHDLSRVENDNDQMFLANRLTIVYLQCRLDEMLEENKSNKVDKLIENL